MLLTNLLQGGPHDPSSGLIDLLGWLRGLSETFYPLDHQFIVRGHNSGTARMERCRGQGMGKDVELPYSVQAPYSPQISMWSSTGELPEPCLSGFFLEGSLHKQD